MSVSLGKFSLVYFLRVYLSFSISTNIFEKLSLSKPFLYLVFDRKSYCISFFRLTRRFDD